MLSTLPSEILIIISSQLESQIDRLSLAGCSHRFRTLLLPHAFTSITIRKDCTWSLSSLVHILVRSPTFAHHVLSLSLNTDNNHCQHPHKIQINEETMQEVLKNLGLTEEDTPKWENDLRGKVEGSWEGQQQDAWSAILLTLLPNLEVLQMEWGHEVDHRRTVLERASRSEGPVDTRPTFSRLREVYIRSYETYTGISVSDVFPFFRFPSMRKFSSHVVIYGHKHEKTAEIPGDCNVTDLALYSSSPTSGFAGLISRCARLESFICQHASGLEWYSPLDHPSLHRKLIRHTNTLKEIAIYCEIDPCRPRGPNEDAFFGSLAGFSVLQKLRLRASNLLDWDSKALKARNHLWEVLPPSLQSLVVEDFHQCPNMEEFVEQLADMIRNSYPGSPGPRSLEIRGILHDLRKYHWRKGSRVGTLLLPAIASAAALLDLYCPDGGVDFAMCDVLLEMHFGCGLVPKESYRVDSALSSLLSR
ncbi:hypothetical protein BDW59DRAFT_145866 [Aspergillus cavernicola]|uniref:Leucine-rich repeat domain-containing protein n=1 Tax=Aspergillus cavernicola TaxID=176166 RepID=A0ABR4IDB6_9EURO